jgi:hypothetical protein
MPEVNVEEEVKLEEESTVAEEYCGPLEILAHLHLNNIVYAERLVQHDIVSCQSEWQTWSTPTKDPITYCPTCGGLMLGSVSDDPSIFVSEPLWQPFKRLFSKRKVESAQTDKKPVDIV